MPLGLAGLFSISCAGLSKVTGALSQGFADIGLKDVADHPNLHRHGVDIQAWHPSLAGTGAVLSLAARAARQDTGRTSARPRSRRQLATCIGQRAAIDRQRIAGDERCIV